MRRPHVYERSVPRASRPVSQGTNQAQLARMIAAQLGNMIDRAEEAGLIELSDLLDLARLKAEADAALQ